MKKRLESELISIAHRILKLKNKSEVDQLYKETQKLYETLSVLKFYGDNFEMLKTEIPVNVMEEKLTNSFEAEEAITIELEVPAVAEVEKTSVEEDIAEEVEETEEEEVVIVDETEEETEADMISEMEEDEVEETKETEEEEVEETVAEIEEVEDEIEDEEETEEEEIEKEELKEETNFKPAFEFTADSEDDQDDEDELEISSESKQVAFEDFLGEGYVDPVFVKPNEVSSPSNSLFSSQESTFESNQPKIVALNDSMSKSISIGLNDRVGFVKFLFADSNEDYNRVLSQLSTFDSFEEAKNFINDMVKPDYNNWEGKDDYEERFMEIVEKKFE
jgi:hypothetical protein